ncbi:MAG: hypothetical protein P3X22_007855 [Thermoprotei archaeon]|nr:hypothetical protein [Thermoprotei archaeon]
MSRHVLRLTIIDPVVLVLACLAAGLIIYYVVGFPLMYVGAGSGPLTYKVEVNPFHFEFFIATGYIDSVSRSIERSFLVLGAVTAVFGAYIVGASRDLGYSSLANLMGIGRRAYLRLSILAPITVYILIPSIATAIIAPPLRDYNFMRYWQVPIAIVLIVLTVLAVQLSIAIILTHIAANTYRGLILTLIALYLLGIMGAHERLIVISREMESLNELLMRIAGVAVIAIIVLAIAYMIVERRTTTR